MNSLRYLGQSRAMVIVLGLSLLALQSCFELKEEIFWQPNGAGTYQIWLDASQSRQIIESHQSLTDSSRSEKNFLGLVDSSFAQVALEINQMKGLSNAQRLGNGQDLVSGLRFDFADVNALNLVLNTMTATETGNKNYFVYTNRQIERQEATYVQKLLEGVFRVHQDDPSMEDEIKELFLKNAFFISTQKAQKEVKLLSGQEAEKLGKKAISWRIGLLEVAQSAKDLEGKWRVK